jgi:uncharacterized protein (DUF1501 family)
MHPEDEAVLAETRRQFFGRGAKGLGSLALFSLLAEQQAKADTAKPAIGGLPGLPHFAPKAKRAIYLHMLGAPPQLETFDYKPGLQNMFDKDLPESIRSGQRLTTMTAGQTRFPIAPSVFKFQQHGQCGAWVSELLPHTAKMVDDIAIIRTLHTDAINHEPAITFLQTGFMIAGKPCIGSWLAYGLGSMNQSLPTFVVLNATHSNPKANVQAISARLWSAGFLSGQYSGVALRSGGDPVLYINNPDGVPVKIRRRMLDALDELNQMQSAKLGDPETQVRIAQYEMAFRMQASVPDLTDISKEPESTYQLYGEDARKGGTFANCCLMARRMMERDVRFVQVYHRGWDVHSILPEVLPSQCRDIDQGAAALVQDLKARGLLDETLVIWGGEFGRTVYSQGKLTATDYGRDHHPRCFSVWMAGGGIKGGVVHGETDDFSYNIVKDPVHIRDFQATILNRFGIEDTRFTFKFQGLDQKLTGTEKKAVVVKDILA